MEYNVISSNCIGGFYYKMNGLPYENPFIWTSIKLSDFICLVKNFATIDLSNIKTSFSSGEFETKEKIKNLPKLIIDNKVSVYFQHHHYANVPFKKVSENIYSNDILSYIEEQWKSRAKKSKYEPVFVFWADDECTDCNLKDFISLKNKFDYKFVLFSEEDYSKYNCCNFKWFERKKSVPTIFYAEKFVNFLK